MPDNQVYFSESFETLREKSFNWIDEHAAGTPESARFLEATDFQRDSIADAWRTQYDGLRLRVSSLAEFALTIHERLYEPYPDVKTLDRRRVIEQALLQLEEEAGFTDARQHTPSFSELFRELEAAGIQDTMTLQERLSETDCSPATQDTVVTAYERYLELIELIAHPDAVSQSAKLTAVADADRPLGEVLPHLDAIVVSGLIDPSAVEVAVLKRLTDAFPVLVLLPTPSPEEPTEGIGGILSETTDTLIELGFEFESVGSAESLPFSATASQLYQPVNPPASQPAGLSWHELSTPNQEVRYLARQLRQTLESGTHDPEDILILAPGLLSYREGIADTFETFEIPHAYRVSILLERTYVGRAVLDLIELAERPHADSLGRLMTNPVVNYPEVDAGEIADIQRRLYTTAIDPFVSELSNSKEAVNALLAHISDVRNAEPEDLVPAFRTVIEQLGLQDAIENLDKSSSIDAGYETRANARVEEILASVQTVCTELAPDDPLAELATALEGVRVPPPPQATDHRVRILGLADTPMATFEQLYVLGATADQLSGAETRPRYFQELGEALGLFDPHNQRDIDRYRFGMLVANATSVHITTPETTIDDEPLLVSPFIDELSRVTGLDSSTGPDGQRRGSRDDLQRAMAGATPENLQPALSTAQTSGHVEAQFTEQALNGARCSANRAASGPSKHDGQLSTDAIAALDSKLTKEPFSHSRLSRYAKCGFKYMLRTGWGLKQDDDIEPGVSPLVVGSIVHDAVEDFYREFQDDSGEPVNLATMNRAMLEQQLLKAGQAAIADAEESFDDLFSQKTLRALFAGLGTPTSNEYHGPVADSANGKIAGALHQFLDLELERAAEGHQPAYFEAEFGNSDGITLPDGRTVPIDGRIDRIDTTAENQITVFDYKTSSVRGARQRENRARDGVDFQLPMYLLGTPSLFTEKTDLTPADINAQYYVINDNPTIKLRKNIGARFADIDFETFLSDTVPARIDDATTGIVAGAFQPAFVGAETAQCEYCAFSDVCDVRHHQRYDVIEYIDEHDHAAYVPDGARPGEVMDHLPGGDADD